VTGQTWAVLLAAFLAGLQLIFYVHSPWSSEASADFCPTLAFSTQVPTSTYKSTDNLGLEDKKGDRLEEAQNPSVSPCPSLVHLLL
jgi:hypothetical protein